MQNQSNDRDPGGALGRDVRARRKDLGLTQEDLADLAGASPRFIGALERGKETVRLDKLTAVLDVLGLELRAALRVITPLDEQPGPGRRA